MKHSQSGRSALLERIDTPDVQRRRLFDVYGNGEQLHSPKRVMSPEAGPEEALWWVTENVAEAKLNGRFTALVAGAFDVPHDAHEWYVRECRLRAAERMLTLRGEEPTVEALRQTIAGDDIFLLVSIDADAALSKRKGGVAEKGGIPRPVYAWQTRAHRIAGYGFERANGSYRPTVDLVSKEGGEFEGTSLGCAYDLVRHLSQYGLLDGYIVFDEHEKDVQTARELGYDPIVIPQESSFAVDPRTGIHYSSSNIIKRIQGKTS